MEAEIEELKIALHAEHPTITVRVLYSYTLKGEDTEEKNHHYQLSLLIINVIHGTFIPTGTYELHKQNWNAHCH